MSTVPLTTALAQRLLRPPAPILRLLTLRRWEVEGEKLDRGAQLAIGISNLRGLSFPDMGPDRARRHYAWINSILEAEPPAVSDTRELTLRVRSGTRSGRAYYPEAAGEARLPGLVYFHGGGHTIGSVDTHDGFCRRLCAGAGCVVVSVDYRLAPENPFPAAIDDCYDATVAVAERSEELGIDRTRLAVGGDSAGGNLAAAVSFIARDVGEPAIDLQVLIYPGVGGFKHNGRRNPALQQGFGLDAKTTKWFWDCYVQGEEGGDPRVAPLELASHAGLPRAIVALAHFDLLRGEGLEYADKLVAAGVPITRLYYPDLPHGFITMSVLPRAAVAISEVIATVRAAFFESAALPRVS
ncbi:MAG: alpha/beta hydrolase [Myxococcota bacterium]